MRNTTAEAVISFLRPHFARYGAPQRLVSDNGPPFASYKIKQFLREWGTQHITSSPYYPQSNGLTERSIQTIKNLLIKAKKEGHDLHYVLLEYRTTPIGKLPAPSQMLMGRQLRNLNTTSNLSLQPDYPIQQIRDTLQQKRNQMIDAQHTQRHPHPATFAPGDNVYYQEGHRDWRPATVHSHAPEPHSFILQTPDGRTFRRTRIHLRPNNNIDKTQAKNFISATVGRTIPIIQHSDGSSSYSNSSWTYSPQPHQLPNHLEQDATTPHQTLQVESSQAPQDPEPADQRCTERIFLPSQPPRILPSTSHDVQEKLTIHTKPQNSAINEPPPNILGLQHYIPATPNLPTQAPFPSSSQTTKSTITQAAKATTTITRSGRPSKKPSKFP